MEKLSISQASKQFGISRARLYQLLEKGTIMGYRSMQRGRGAGSWVDSNSLNNHIETREEKAKNSKSPGRPKAMAEGDYLPVRLAAYKISYTTQYINRLIKRGSVDAKKSKGVSLVFYPSLLKYLEK